MNKPTLAAARNFLIGSLAATVTPIVAAQGVGAVVESQPSIPGQAPSSPQAQPASSNDALSLLLDQNRQLRMRVLLLLVSQARVVGLSHAAAPHTR